MGSYKTFVKNKQKKNTEVCKISKSTWSKVFCLKQKQKYKNKTPIQDAVGYKANVFAPKQGYITLGGFGWGSREEIQDSDSFCSIMDGCDDLFIYSPLLSSSLLSSVCLPCFLKNEGGTWRERRRGQVQLHFRRWEGNHRGHIILISSQNWC